MIEEIAQMIEDRLTREELNRDFSRPELEQRLQREFDAVYKALIAPYDRTEAQQRAAVATANGYLWWRYTPVDPGAEEERNVLFDRPAQQFLEKTFSPPNQLFEARVELRELCDRAVGQLHSVAASSAASSEKVAETSSQKVANNLTQLNELIERSKERLQELEDQIRQVQLTNNDFEELVTQSKLFLRECIKVQSEDEAREGAFEEVEEIIRLAFSTEPYASASKILNLDSLKTELLETYGVAEATPQEAAQLEVKIKRVVELEKEWQRKYKVLQESCQEEGYLPRKLKDLVTGIRNGDAEAVNTYLRHITTNVGTSILLGLEALKAKIQKNSLRFSKEFKEVVEELYGFVKSLFDPHQTENLMATLVGVSKALNSHLNSGNRPSTAGVFSPSSVGGSSSASASAASVEGTSSQSAPEKREEKRERIRKVAFVLPEDGKTDQGSPSSSGPR